MLAFSANCRMTMIIAVVVVDRDDDDDAHITLHTSLKWRYIVFHKEQLHCNIIYVPSHCMPMAINYKTDCPSIYIVALYALYTKTIQSIVMGRYEINK